MASLFKIKVNQLKGVGGKTAEYLSKLGVISVGDLINFFPRTYEDWSSRVLLPLACGKRECCVKVEILSHSVAHRIKGGRTLYKLNGADENNNIVEIVFFNNRFTPQSMKKGNYYLIRGNFKRNLGHFEVVSPKVKDVCDSGYIFPIYNQTQGITSNKIASFVRSALEMLPDKISETIPEWILERYDLCSYDFALRNIHFPDSKESLRIARRRLVFEEFFIYQLGLGFIKRQSRKPTEVVIEDKAEEFYRHLPFELTNAQKRSIRECITDMKSGKFAMNRLLQGDVGSGKTAVAATLAYCVAKSGYQVAIMAPTEILAAQHYDTFLKFFKDTGLNVSLISGSLRDKEKRRLQQEAELGFSDIIIGTHALISEKMSFKKLGLVVTDEQHRFGVKQRSTLINKGLSPHVLVMSATPIPRTLALIVYGDLDISVLDETLPGRQKIDTFRIDEGKRYRALNFMKEIVQDGGQAYIVCAGIDENENDVIDVSTYYEKVLKDIFDFSEVGILHGKMHPSDKEEIMQRFINGDIKVLVATTVIEVGVDVPNARIIMIENAERFGISQLHQLRGRVGRSSNKSYCILVSNSKSRDSNQRFNAMTSSNDGFYLSEEDLKLRGPGDFFGTNQHGVPNIGIPTSYEDIGIAKQAQDAVSDIMNGGYDLNSNEFRFVRAKLNHTFEMQGTNLNREIVF